jgi:hypothetical protein
LELCRWNWSASPTPPNPKASPTIPEHPDRPVPRLLRLPDELHALGLQRLVIPPKIIRLKEENTGPLRHKRSGRTLPFPTEQPQRPQCLYCAPDVRNWSGDVSGIDTWLNFLKLSSRHYALPAISRDTGRRKSAVSPASSSSGQ